MSVRRRSGWFLSLLLVAGLAVALPSGGVWAHGGAAGEGVDTCKAEGHKYGLDIHFTAYLKQQGQMAFEGYCDRIPGLGTAALVFELATPELRNTPVAFVVERVVGGQREEVLRVPARSYADGVATVNYDFEQPGRYVATALVESVGSEAAGQEIAFSFPVTVGGGGFSGPAVLAASAVAVALVGGGYAFYRKRQEQR